MSDNQIREMRLIREKDEAVYEVTLTFSKSSAPKVIFDEYGNPQVIGGNYQIKKATWGRYQLDGPGTYIKPDKPLTNWGDGPISGCKVGWANGEPAFIWDHEEDFAIAGRGVKTHVRRLDRADYRFREILQMLKEDHPGITRGPARNRLASIIREELPKKTRPNHQPTGRRRGAPRSEFAIQVTHLREAGISCRTAQKKMFTWHRRKFPLGHSQSRERESIARSVRRIYAEKNI